MQGRQLYPTITPCGVGGRHSPAVFDHGTYIILAQRNPKFRAQQIDLERMVVVFGDGGAPLVINVTEVHRGIGVSVIERSFEEVLGGLTITIPAVGVVKSLREFP